MTRAAGWLLAVSYGIGGPVCLGLELRRQLFSERFDVPSILVVAVCVLQLACALVILRPRFATAAAGALTFTTVGAIFAHLRIGSPFTTLPAIAYTVIQVLYARAMRGAR
jgi:hypothetical protein